MITVTRHYKSIDHFLKHGVRGVRDWDLSKEALAQYKAMLADRDMMRRWAHFQGGDYDLEELMEQGEVELAEIDDELAAAEDVCRHLSKKLMRLEKQTRGAGSARYQALQNEYEVTARKYDLLDEKLQRLKGQKQEFSQRKKRLRKQKARTSENAQVCVTRTDDRLVVRIGGRIYEVVPFNVKVRRKRSYKSTDPFPGQERSLKALASKQKLLNQRR
ncbi:hypothetical protein SAMN04488518_110115 [Pseudovibrio ascidiaceicola]|uniref:Uncharacterized protein n=1 Tax=Pseudovibrio ascidiaceicola TaxID=285279 RepID=A0A1I4CYT3_9HYPH|nr:hypothetical protein [Pseudovibrio ascidiaceicola]SFK86045.1 hypothetical protein SAMN04488518_110115 [Pseudovibrio ascidiaceicola]